jgi:anaphase-promoting complex subunit 3
MEAELLAIIHDSLKLYIYSNALFYAERLFSLSPSLTSLATLAHCYLVSGDAATCARLVSSTPMDPLTHGSLESSKTLDAQRKRCWYLLGVSCVQCERYAEAETALLNVIPSDDGAAEYWLGVCGKRMGRSHAVTNFRSSFERSPALFSAYEELVGLQKAPDSLAANGGPVYPNLYTDICAKEESFSAQQQRAASAESDSAAAERAEFAASWNSNDEGAHGSSRFSAPPPPKNIPSSTSTRKGPASSAINVRGASASPPPVPTNRGPGSPTKRASFASTTAGSWGGPMMSRRTSSSGTMTLSVGLVRFLACYAEVATLMAAFQCRDAIQLLSSDPVLERDTLWSAPNIAMCHFHLGASADARVHFEKMRQIARWKLHDARLIYFSTVLWHLKDAHALGYLTQTLMEQSPIHVVTLAVAGNCYSLAKDAKMAAQVLTRAVSIDKTVPYVSTLLGYELLAVQPDKAEKAFVDALHLDQRHYMALAGLGELAYRSESIAKAQHYFTAALSINRQPTIMNRLASTYHRPGANKDHLRTALDIYDACIQRSPANIGARHHRVEVLMKMRRYEDAMYELERLRVDCPEEAALFMSLGKCAHRLGRVAQANQYYHKVLDLDPRKSVAAKACLERLQQNLPPDDE